MKTVFLFFGFVALMAAEPSSSQVRGKKLIEESVAALGGERFLSVQDRTEKGRAYSFYREKLTGLAQATFFIRYTDTESDGKLAQSERQSFGKKEDYLILFLPDAAYQVTYRGAKPLEEARFTRYRETTRRNIFYLLRTRLKEPGLLMEYQGSTIWSNMPVDIVNITDADNNVVSVYIQQSTKFPVRQTFTRRDPINKDRIDEESIFAKYRADNDGVQWPFSVMSYRNGEKVFEQYLESVEFNKSLPDAMFQLPPGLKTIR